MSTSIETNGSADIVAECNALRDRCAELTKERDQLRQELGKAQSERDSHLKSLYYFLRKESPPPDFTKEELLAYAGKEPPLEEFIAALEREMRSGA